MWHLAWHATQKSSLTAHEKEISKHKKTTKCVTRRVKRCFVCSFRALHLLASHQCLFTWGESDISVSWYPEKQNFKKKKKGTKKKKNRQTRFKNWALQVHLCTFCIADELIVLVQHVQHQSSLLWHSLTPLWLQTPKLHFFLANSAPCLFCGSKQPIVLSPKPPSAWRLQEVSSVPGSTCPSYWHLHMIPVMIYWC